MVTTTVEPNATNNAIADNVLSVVASFQVPAVLACRLPHICYKFEVHCRNSTCGSITYVANHSLKIKCWPQLAGRRFHMLSTGNWPVIIYLTAAALAAIGRADSRCCTLLPSPNPLSRPRGTRDIRNSGLTQTSWQDDSVSSQK
jgi:hypothetical protein